MSNYSFFIHELKPIASMKVVILFEILRLFLHALVISFEKSYKDSG